MGRAATIDVATRVLAHATVLMVCLGVAHARQFDYIERIDPITDADQSMVVVYSEDLVEAWLRNQDADGGVLAVHCDGEGGFGYFFRYTEAIKHEYPLAVWFTYRFDGDEPVRARWSLGATLTGAVGPDHLAEAFVERLRLSNRFVTRFETRSGQEITLVFNTTGMSMYLDALSCLR